MHNSVPWLHGDARFHCRILLKKEHFMITISSTPQSPTLFLRLPLLSSPFRICFASSHFPHVSSHFVNKICGGEKKKKLS